MPGGRGGGTREVLEALDRVSEEIAQFAEHLRDANREYRQLAFSVKKREAPKDFSTRMQGAAASMGKGALAGALTGVAFGGVLGGSRAYFGDEGGFLAGAERSIDALFAKFSSAYGRKEDAKNSMISRLRAISDEVAMYGGPDAAKKIWGGEIYDFLAETEKNKQENVRRIRERVNQDHQFDTALDKAASSIPAKVTNYFRIAAKVMSVFGMRGPR